MATAALNMASSLFTWLTTSTAGQALLYTAISYGANAALANQQKISSSEMGSVLRTQVASDVPGQIIFGTRATAGSFCARLLTGSHNDRASFIVPLAEHRCSKLKRVWANGSEVYGPAVSASHTGLQHGVRTVLEEFNSGGERAWITFFDGRFDQSSATISSAPYWSSQHTGTGRAYVVIEIKFDDDNLLTPPNWLFEIEGGLFYDRSKDSTAGGSGAHRLDDENTWEYTTNPAVIWDHYRQGIYRNGLLWWGLGQDPQEDPYDLFAARKALCDEDVSLKGGGTQNRYELNGIADATMRHADIARDIALAMGGHVVDVGGRAHILAGQAQAPVLTLDEGELIVDAPFVYTEKVGYDELVNRVEATYSDPDDDYNPTLAPIVEDAAALEADGGIEHPASVELRFETDVERAQRLASIVLRDARKQARLTGTFPIRAVQLEPGDWFTFTSSRLGFSGGKTFRVLSRTLNPDLTVTLIGVETDATVTAWSANQAADISRPTIPTSALAPIETPVFTVTPRTLDGGGASTPALTIAWTAPTDPRVKSIHIEVTPTAGGDPALHTVQIEDAVTQIVVDGGITAGTSYDVRARFIGSLQRSAWADAITKTTSPTYAVGSASSVPWSGVTDDGGKPEDDATVGADWSANVSNKPATLEEIETGWDAAINSAIASAEADAAADLAAAEAALENSIDAASQEIASAEARLDAVEPVVSAQGSAIADLDLELDGEAARVTRIEGSARRVNLLPVAYHLPTESEPPPLALTGGTLGNTGIKSAYRPELDGFRIDSGTEFPFTIVAFKASGTPANLSLLPGRYIARIGAQKTGSVSGLILRLRDAAAVIRYTTTLVAPISAMDTYDEYEAVWDVSDAYGSAYTLEFVFNHPGAIGHYVWIGALQLSQVGPSETTLGAWSLISPEEQTTRAETSAAIITVDTARESGDAALTAQLAAQESELTSDIATAKAEAITYTDTAVSDESSARTSALAIQNSELQADIATAQADAESYTDTAVSAEAGARSSDIATVSAAVATIPAGRNLAMDSKFHFGTTYFNDRYNATGLTVTDTIRNYGSIKAFRRSVSGTPANGSQLNFGCSAANSRIPLDAGKRVEVQARFNSTRILQARVGAAWYDAVGVLLSISFGPWELYPGNGWADFPTNPFHAKVFLTGPANAASASFYAIAQTMNLSNPFWEIGLPYIGIARVDQTGFTPWHPGPDDPAQVTTIQASAAALDSRVATVETDLGDEVVARSSAISAVEASVGEVEAEVATQDLAISDINGKMLEYHGVKLVGSEVSFELMGDGTPYGGVAKLKSNRFEIDADVFINGGLSVRAFFTPNDGNSILNLPGSASTDIAEFTVKGTGNFLVLTLNGLAGSFRPSSATVTDSSSWEMRVLLNGILEERANVASLYPPLNGYTNSVAFGRAVLQLPDDDATHTVKVQLSPLHASWSHDIMGHTLEVEERLSGPFAFIKSATLPTNAAGYSTNPGIVGPKVQP